MYVLPCPHSTFVRYVEDSLSDHLLRQSVSLGATIGVDMLPSGDITVVHRMLPGALVDAHQVALVGEACP